MKTILVDCSPKKRFSTSGYLLSHLSFTLPGKKNRIKLAVKNYDKICEGIEKSDNLILALPTYVDGVPASVLKFLKYVEEFVKEKDLKLKVYVICNCGFYEGKQNANSLAILEQWCKKCRFVYKGGLGLGAGEMFGALRIVTPFLAIFSTLIIVLALIIKYGSNLTFMHVVDSCYLNIVINIAVYFIFNTLMYIKIAKLSYAIRKRKPFKNSFTTVLCPKFLFVFFADIFWIIRAIFKKVPVWRLYEKRVND